MTGGVMNAPFPQLPIPQLPTPQLPTPQLVVAPPRHFVPAQVAPSQQPGLRRLGLGAPLAWGWVLGPGLLLLYWSVLSATGWLDPRVLPAPWTAVETAIE